MENNNENHKDDEDMMEEELLFDYWVNHLCFYEEYLVESTNKIKGIDELNGQKDKA
ncbi:MAG TPA: hypothetical protein VN721_11890 [Flavipsychrobacter sp.]|nr:hypothetical protein [Flavipsychrobacter sp.]